MPARPPAEALPFSVPRSTLACAPPETAILPSARRRAAVSAPPRRALRAWCTAAVLGLARTLPARSPRRGTKRARAPTWEGRDVSG